MDCRFWKSSKIPGRVFVEPNKKISMAEIRKYSETLYEKFWVFKNVFLLKEYLVYVETKEYGNKVVATLSSEVVESAISTIRERKRREFEKRKFTRQEQLGLRLMRMMRRSEEREKELSTWELASINSRVKEVIRKVEEEVSLINNHDIILHGKY